MLRLSFHPTKITASISACLLALPLLAGGCVQQKDYDAMLQANRSLQEQVVSVSDERDVARANIDTLRAQLGKATSELNGLKAKYGQTDADLVRLAAEYDALMKRVGSLDFGPLPEEMNRALEELARQYPQLLTYDSKRGMLRFSSDFTFASGSADLNPSAAASLAQLAKILNTPTAQGFEVRVIGHTDNQPISSAATRAKHPTNWHLSAHRAISVGSALMTSGVSSGRFQVAGYGEYRPIVPNPAKGGAQQNRRVEIFLLPMPDHVPTSTPASATANVPTPAAPEEPMK